jgi:ribosomal protein S18 acetylase RimI-like enzyme
MRVDDVPKVYALGEQVFSAKSLPVLYRTWDPYEVALLFASETELSLVAERDGQVVGFCLTTTIEKPGKPWRYGYIIWLAVDRRKWLQGVGRRLVAETTRRLRERRARYMLVDTPEENSGALDFFKRLGYQERSRQIWLWKDLEPGSKGRPGVEEMVGKAQAVQRRARRVR